MLGFIGSALGAINTGLKKAGSVAKDALVKEVSKHVLPEAKAAAADILDDASARLGNQAIQAASPGAVLLTRDMQLWIGGGLLAVVLLFLLLRR